VITAHCLAIGMVARFFPESKGRQRRVLDEARP
jgi:hypothetical protein